LKKLAEWFFSKSASSRLMMRLRKSGDFRYEAILP